MYFYNRIAIFPGKDNSWLFDTGTLCGKTLKYLMGKYNDKYKIKYKHIAVKINKAFTN